MCGIFSILNNQFKEEDIIANFEHGKARGPEESSIKWYKDLHIVLGFHRLAINGLNNSAMQPLKKNNCILICNGEIYNSKELHKLIGVANESGSDCEIITDLYLKYGITQTLRVLDGVYAFVLVDITKEKIFIARDMFGVRPLFQLCGSECVGFASEIKTLYNLKDDASRIIPFPPGACHTYNICMWKKQWTFR